MRMMGAIYESGETPPHYPTILQTTYLSPMALIRCRECNNAISNMASACPHCGWPVEVMHSLQDRSFDVYTSGGLSDDLFIGQQITNWGYDAVLDGDCWRGPSAPHQVPEGKLQLRVHTGGICVAKSLFGEVFLNLHKSQILRMEAWDSEWVETRYPSMVGRTLLGAAAFGRAGAAIGAYSATQPTLKVRDDAMLVLTYRVKEQEQPLILYVRSRRLMVEMFIRRYHKQMAKNAPNVRPKDRPVLGCFIILAFLGIIVALIMKAC